MSWKNINQRSLADALQVDHAALRELDEVESLIDWSSIERVLSGIHNKSRGEQAWPPLLMFKALLLQSWYNLSDPQLEKQLARDLLFRRFVGLSLSESVPDHSTLWRFRNNPEVIALQDRLFNEINDQLIVQGLLIKQGEISIIDTSVIQAQRNRPKRNAAGKSTQDPEAGHNTKVGSDGTLKRTYGYKAHINVDEDGFIKATELTPGNVHDSRCFTELLSGNESMVFADSAYASKATDQWLKRRGIRNGVLERAYRNTPLTRSQKASNKKKSYYRCGVERVFGILKCHYGLGKARHLGKVRNKIRLVLCSLAYNIKRGATLQREMACL